MRAATARFELPFPDWRNMYNEFRPHRSLKGKTPKEFEREFKKQYQTSEVLSS